MKSSQSTSHIIKWLFCLISEEKKFIHANPPFFTTYVMFTIFMWPSYLYEYGKILISSLFNEPQLHKVSQGKGQWKVFKFMFVSLCLCCLQILFFKYIHAGSDCSKNKRDIHLMSHISFHLFFCVLNFFLRFCLCFYIRLDFNEILRTF